MTVATVSGVEIDRCRTCGGVVLDKGEQDAIEHLQIAQVIEGGAASPHQRRESAAYCHPCERQMIALRGAGDVEYDWCELCERLFFDRGELSTIAAFTDA